MLLGFLHIRPGQRLVGMVDFRKASFLFPCGNLFVCSVLGGFQPSVAGEDVTVLEVVR